MPTDSVSINNTNFVGNAINPVTYTGIRASALYKINDDWDALLTQSYQNMNAQGVFYEMPTARKALTSTTSASRSAVRPLPPLSVDGVQPIVQQG